MPQTGFVFIETMLLHVTTQVYVHPCLAAPCHCAGMHSLSQSRTMPRDPGVCFVEVRIQFCRFAFNHFHTMQRPNSVGTTRAQLTTRLLLQYTTTKISVHYATTPLYVTRVYVCNFEHYLRLDYCCSVPPVNLCRHSRRLRTAESLLGSSIVCCLDIQIPFLTRISTFPSWSASVSIL